MNYPHNISNDSFPLDAYCTIVLVKVDKKIILIHNFTSNGVLDTHQIHEVLSLTQIQCKHWADYTFDGDVLALVFNCVAITIYCELCPYT